MLSEGDLAGVGATPSTPSAAMLSRRAILPAAVSIAFAARAPAYADDLPELV